MINLLWLFDGLTGGNKLVDQPAFIFSDYCLSFLLYLPGMWKEEFVEKIGTTFPQRGEMVVDFSHYLKHTILSTVKEVSLVYLLVVLQHKN